MYAQNALQNAYFIKYNFYLHSFAFYLEGILAT